MYNKVYDAIKAVRPDALVGGPYASMTTYGKPVRGKPSVISGPYGYFDQGMLDAVSYWLAHKVGADFLAVDGSTQVAKSNDSSLMTPAASSVQYAAVDAWLRSQTSLPIWWMESHIQPESGWTVQQAAAARIATLAEMASSGAAVGMQWQPQEQNGWPDQGLWTSTLVPGGGQPTALAKVLPSVLPILEASPLLVDGQPDGVVVVSADGRTLAINTTNAPSTARTGKGAVPLSPGEVVVLP
jgi:hypothetical protein